MSFLVDRLTEVAPAVVYLTVGLLVFGEAAIFLGFILPGETAVIIGGFLASRGHVNVVAMCAVVVVAAIVGDSVGYLVGQRWGVRLLGLPVLRRRKAGMAAALTGLERRGGTYVFLGRFTAFFRAVVPGLAGMSAMPYRRFLVANAAGGLCWGVGYTLLGYFAGNAYTRVEHYSTYAAIGVAVLVVAMAVVFSIRGRRKERAEESAFESSHVERTAAATGAVDARASTPADPDAGPPVTGST